MISVKDQFLRAGKNIKNIYSDLSNKFQKPKDTFIQNTKSALQSTGQFLKNRYMSSK